MAEFELNPELEQKYRSAALALWELPDVPYELEPDNPMPVHPWEPNIGRRSIAAKYALIALRRKLERTGDDALTGPEQEALRQYDKAADASFKTFDGQTLLASARYLAVRALVEGAGLEFTP